MSGKYTCMVFCVLAVGNIAQASNSLNVSNKLRGINYTYNEQGLLTHIDGPRTDVQDMTSFTYDAKGRLLKTINPLGHVTEVLAYNVMDQPLSFKDANGVITKFNYNGFGWLTAIEVNQDKTLFEHNALAQITKITLPDNSYIRYEYDDARRLVAIEDNQGSRVEYQLDLAGNRVKADFKNSTGTILNTQQYVFDELSRIISSTSGEGNTSSYSYSKNNQTTQITDALSNITKQSYDALNRLMSVEDAQKNKTEYAYSDIEQVSAITDAEGKTTNYEHNNFNEQTRLSSPDTGNTSYSYDEAGNMISVVDARGVAAKYSHDALSRLSSVVFNNKDENISFSYDDVSNANKGIGRLTQVEDNSGKSHYTYDDLGRIVKISYEIESSHNKTLNTQSYQATYQYHSGGQVSSVTYPSGRQVSYTTNSLGLIEGITVKAAGSQQSQSVLSNISYLPFGPVKDFSYGNGLSASKTYDADYRLTGDNLGSLKQQQLTYSKIGNITQITDIKDNNRNQTLSYDSLSRLTGATGQYGTFSYGYDKIGNRTVKQEGVQNHDYQYKNENHHLKQVSASAYNQPQNYLSRYNQAGRLAELRSSSVKTTYRYNYRGLRTTKINNQEQTHYHYDINGLLIAESSASGTWQKEYIYFNQQLVAMVDYSQHAQGQLYYVHSNYLDTPELVTDVNKNVIWQAHYTPFGLATVNDDVDSDSNKLVLNIRFPGQYYDTESELYYNWFRYYDPVVGRYIESDPIGLDDGVNTYAYVGGNPTNYFDNEGLSKRRVNQPTPLQQMTNVEVNVLINQIRQIDTTFTYATARPAGPRGRYNQTDINALNQYLRNAQSAGFCGPGASNAPGFLQNGGVSMTNLFQSIIPPGTPNLFTSSTMSGFRFVWEANGTRMRVWGHTSNPTAPAGSFSATNPTISMRVNNRYVTSTGTTVGNPNTNAEIVHIPVRK